MKRSARFLAGAALAALLTAGCVKAGPWAEIGDSALRSDILVLAAAGVIDDITMQWPLPWTGIMRRLSVSTALDGQPDYVREAARRVLARGKAEVRTRRLMPSVTFDGASEPGLVRGFDAMGRSTFEGQATVEALWDTTALKMSVGGRLAGYGDHQALMLDESYVAQRVGNVVVYAGSRTHWWGPGWVSALSQSNSARPMPQIGISRIDTAPFESPWLRWIGPWQAELFAGLLGGPRIAENTAYVGFRVGFSPIEHLEIGFARLTMLCGSGHECKPLADYFGILNDPNNANKTNDQGNIDVRFSDSWQSFAYEIYLQLMNEDTSPILHSGTTHLFGASLWLPVRDGTGRMTLEYTDSVATMDVWGGGTMHGFAYNNGTYRDGMRYRGRTMGFSLDGDSRLLSLQVGYDRNVGDSYRLTFHHAEISTSENPLGNVVTAAPVIVNQLEARIDYPVDLGLDCGNIRLELAGRVQDDRPRPENGWLASVEARLRMGF